MAASSQKLPMSLPSGETSLAEALESFAAGQPSPGSGSANALIGAVAAALTASVAKKTVQHADTPRYRPISDRARGIANRATKWSRELLRYFEEDAAAFRNVVAIRLKADTLSEKYLIDQARH